MPTQVELCNLALSKVSELPIVTIIDSLPRAQSCAQEYQGALDEVLEEAFWPFAQTRLALTINSTAPAFGYASAFDLPADFINVEIFNNANVEDYDPQRLYKIESLTDGTLQLLTNEEAANIVYTRNGTVFTSPQTIDTFAGLMTPLFITAFTTLLAAKIAPLVKNDGPAFASGLLAIYKTEVSKGRTRGANMRKRQPIRPESESRVRGARRISTSG